MRSEKERTWCPGSVSPPSLGGTCGWCGWCGVQRARLGWVPSEQEATCAPCERVGRRLRLFLSWSDDGCGKMMVWLMSPCSQVRSAPEMCPFGSRGSALASPGKDASPGGRFFLPGLRRGLEPWHWRSWEGCSVPVLRSGQETWLAAARKMARGPPADGSSLGPFLNPRLRQCSCCANFRV